MFNIPLSHGFCIYKTPATFKTFIPQWTCGLKLEWEEGGGKGTVHLRGLIKKTHTHKTYL